MRLARRHLLDVNVLVALTSVEHEHHREAIRWFDSLGRQEWGICPLTELGYVRFTTNPATRIGTEGFSRATAVLAELAQHPGFRYWPMKETLAVLTAPFRSRIFGHQQVTDTYLLGLVVKEDDVLVTFDKGFKYLAGSEFARNILILD